MSTVNKIFLNGLWRQNTAVVQLLGLCPLIAVSTTFISAFSLGLATIFVMAVSNFAVSCFRHQIPENIRIPVFIVIIASLVTIVEMWITVLSYPLYLALGIYLPLIVTNCIVLARVEAFASKQSPWQSLLDGLAMGGGALGVLVILGTLREILGTGMLFSGIGELLSKDISPIRLFSEEMRLSIASMPFAGFFLLGFLVAAKRAIDLYIFKHK